MSFSAFSCVVVGGRWKCSRRTARESQCRMRTFLIERRWHDNTKIAGVSARAELQRAPRDMRAKCLQA